VIAPRDTQRLLALANRFAHVDTWVFDLDNTLYPRSCDLWVKIDARITLFLMRLFGLDAISSRALQKHYYLRYGTTLRGLMVEHGVDPHQYLAFVHEVDRSSLLPNHTLAHAIMALPGRKLILTNGSRDHAMKTARQLGLEHVFEEVFDIIAADFIAKPDEAAYDRFFDRCRVDPERSAIFEDIARNLIVPHNKGMTTVLVEPEADRLGELETWEVAKGHEPHIDFVTGDLVEFLEGLAGKEGASAKGFR